MGFNQVQCLITREVANLNVNSETDSDVESDNKLVYMLRFRKKVADGFVQGRARKLTGSGLT